MTLEEDLSAGGFIKEDVSYVRSEVGPDRRQGAERAGDAVGNTSDWGWSQASVSGSFGVDSQ